MAGIVTTNSQSGPGVAGSRPVRSRTARDVEFWFGSLAFDSSYPTGGEAWDAEAETGFSDIVQVWIQDTAGYSFQYVDSDTAASRKVKAFWVDTTTDGAAQAEVVDTTSLAGLTAVQVMVVGYR